MRFEVTCSKSSHKDIVTCCSWTAQNEIITCSDDNTIMSWRVDDQTGTKLFSIDVCITALSWMPSSGKSISDSFAVSCVDGTFRLLNRSGREEKKVQACDNGAIISIQWNHDGTALVTGSEDGMVKIWSRTGNLRSILAQLSTPIYTVIWGPDNDQLLYNMNGDLIIKTIEVGKKQIQWKAHEGIVLKTDWNLVNNRIVSGGEDGIYRIWDSFGRLLYASKRFDYAITSLRWNLHGEYFVAGTNNLLVLCDKTGWIYSQERIRLGSIMDVVWALDGTQCACVGGNGKVAFCRFVERSVESQNFQVILTSPKCLQVHNIANDTIDKLDFERDPVIDFSIAYDYLVVVTVSQCFIYHTTNWNTPHIFDIKTPIYLIIQSQRYFITADLVNGIYVYSYEGRVISNPKFSGLRVEALSALTISINNDILAILDNSTRQTIRLFDILTSRALSVAITHHVEITSLSLCCESHSEGVYGKKLFFIDINHDLHLTPIHKKSIYKLATQIDTAIWHDSTEQLVAIGDNKLYYWSYPSLYYIDKYLAKYIIVMKDATEYSKYPQLLSFHNSEITLRCMDGTLITTMISPYPSLLYEEVYENNEYEKAVRLCRFAKSNELWGCLAGMSLISQRFEIAEIALSALEEVDRLHFILYLKKLSTDEERNAEIALYRGDIDEAENILLQSNPPFIYRAIKLNIRIFRWQRALDLAIRYKTHVDTVLYYRNQYLLMNHQEEADPRFIEYSKQVVLDVEVIKAKKRQEKGRRGYNKDLEAK